MIFNIGDKVRYLNEVGGGTVVRIIDKKNIEIVNEHGMNIPVPIHELVKIENKINVEEKKTETVENIPYVTNNSYNYAERDQWDYLTDKKNENEQPNIKADDSTNIYLAFVPEDDSNISDSELNMYLINDSKFHILYSVSTEENKEYVNIDAGKIEPNIKSYIATYKREDISKLNSILIQIIFYKTGYFSPKNTIDETYKIKPSKFFKNNIFIENEFFEEKAILIPVYLERDLIEFVEKLSQNDIQRIIEENNDLVPDSKSKHKFERIDKKEIVEVDLHIQELIEDYRGLSNGEMLNIQLNHFKKHLENAIANKVKRIVFIHGIGNGTLRTELRKILNENYSDIPYQDASFKEYGYGATMLLLK